jgi:peptidoglycan/LPS O-acetylase OafA/YrhL
VDMEMLTTSSDAVDGVSEQRDDGGATPHIVPRIHVLDGLRLLAALFVATWHLTGIDDPAVWRGSPRTVVPAVHAVGVYGWVGVELFFLISGFVICMSSWDRRVGDFVGSRAARLLPGYWAAVVFTSVVLWFSPTIFGYDGAKPTLTRVLSNLTMMHMPLGVDSIDPVYWTLWYELRFYVLFGVMLAFGLTYRRVLVFCGVWGFLSVLAPQSNWPPLDAVVGSDYSWFFIGGIVIYLMRRFGQNLLLWGLLVLCWLMGQNRIQDPEGANASIAHQPIGWTVTVVAMTAAFALVTAAGLGAFDRVRWRWLTTAGAVSYPFYLLHEKIGWELINRFRGSWNGYVSLAAAVAVILTLAWVLHLAVERPLSPLIRNGLRTSFAAVRRDARPALDDPVALSPATAYQDASS